MLIKTKIYLGLLLAIFITIILGLFVYQSAKNIRQDNNVRSLTTNFVRYVYECNVLTVDYLLLPSERAKKQWQSKHEQVGSILKEIVAKADWQGEELQNLLVSYNRLSQDFKNLTEKYQIQISKNYDWPEVLKNKLEETKNNTNIKDWHAEFINFLSTQNNQILLGQSLREKLVGQILAESQLVVANSFSFLQKIDNQIQSNQTTAYILGTLIVLLLFLIIVVLFLLFYRGVIGGFFKLFEGVNEIAAGHYGYRLNIKRNDEIGQLAEAFDNMGEAIKINRQKIADQAKIVVQKQAELEEQKEAILNVLEDVEEEKSKSEILANDLQKFKLAVEEASDQILITDIKGVILHANRAAEKYTGYRIVELVGHHPEELWAKRSDIAKFYSQIWKTVKEKKGPIKGEIANHDKKGREYIVQVFASPILDEHNEVRFIVEIERDITHEKQVNRAKTEFVSLASHQLRTPLTAVNWYAEMLLDRKADKLSSTQKKYVETIYSSNLRMTNLVNSLLNVSRMEMGTLIVEPERIDIRKVADMVISELAHNIELKHIELIKYYNKNLPAEVVVDPQITKIIIQNLLSNSVKYSHDRGKIELYMGVEGNNILIKVADYGLGIPHNQQNQIFTKLFRADNVRQKDTDGTGLGLYLVKAILDGIGGRVWFESEENKGSVFYVTFSKKGMKQKSGTKRLEKTTI